jgi:hypothetical protein
MNCGRQAVTKRNKIERLRSLGVHWRVPTVGERLFSLEIVDFFAMTALCYNISLKGGGTENEARIWEYSKDIPDVRRNNAE